MKRTAIIGLASAILLTGTLALAAEPGSPGGAGMQQAPKAMGQHAMKQRGVKKAHSRRMSPEQIQAIQKALNAHGAKLTVDGRWGKETREAIRSFQQENGLRPTGYANAKTRGKLGLKF